MNINLSPDDIWVIRRLISSEWARLDGERGMGLDDEFETNVKQQQRLERLQEKLKGLPL